MIHSRGNRRLAVESLEGRRLLSRRSITPEVPTVGDTVDVALYDEEPLNIAEHVIFYLDDGDGVLDVQDRRLGGDFDGSDGWGITFPTAEEVTILPVGDSITQPQGQLQSYRYPLWQKLVDAGFSFDFIGSQNTNRFGVIPHWPDYQGESFDRDHEGHYGKRADYLADVLPRFVREYTADIAMVHVGTNDLLLNHGIESTLADWERIINVLRQDNPNVVILASLLIPADQLGNHQLVSFNEALPGAVEKWTTEESPVILVDNFTDFDPAVLTVDTLHPNSVGEKQIADRWFETLEHVIPRIAEPIIEPGTHQVFAVAGQGRSQIGEAIPLEFTLHTPGQAKAIEIRQAAHSSRRARAAQEVASDSDSDSNSDSDSSIVPTSDVLSSSSRRSRD